MPLFQSLADRAWFAWNCLPRDERGDRPKIRELERANGLTNGSLHRLITGVSVRPGFAQLAKMATALNTTPEWLQFEKGTAPTTSWPVPPRPPSRTVGERGLDKRALTKEADGLLESSKPRRSRKASKK